MNTILLALALAVPVDLPYGQVAPGRVGGSIVDGATGRPLADAIVTLEPRDAGTLSTPRELSTQVTARRTVSDPAGSYTFDGLPEGGYVLRVERIGYRSARVEISLGSAGAPRLSFGLEVEPIPLEPLVVATEATSPGRGDLRAPESPATQLAVEELRRARYLEPDVQLVTGRDVAMARTFPEDDLLRAVQRLPGISTRDDYSAELWTRGSTWGQTRVYLDDLPLFDPFFAAGALTGLGPSAVGGVFLHPGARPVTIGDGAAGVVRIGTRDAQSVDGLPLLGEMGLGTMQFTTERRFLGGDAGVLLSGRRSWLDRVWNTFVDDGYDPEGPFDYVARSSFLRADARIGDGGRLVVSRYRGGDEVGGNAAGLLTATDGSWGNTVEQMSLTLPLLGRAGRIVVGRSVYNADVHPAPDSFVDPVDPAVVVLRPGATAIRYHLARIELAPRTAGEGLRAGLEVVGQSLAARGVSAAAPEAGVTGPAVPSTSNEVVSAWGAYRMRVSPRVELEGGLRIDAGAAILDRGSLRFGPHVAARFSPAADTYVSLAGRRSFQRLQQVGAAGTPFAGGHTFGHSWTMAGPTVPLLTTDIASAGVERRLDTSWWLVGNVWARRSAGVTTSDPTMGVTPTAPVSWTVGESRAKGFEVQIRRLTGAVTGSAAYSWALSQDRAVSRTFPSPADRRHTFFGVGTWRVTSGLQIGASFRAYSGAPFTRVLRDPCVDDLARTDACSAADPWEFRGPASSRRGPGYVSLDVGVDWVRRHGTWGWGVSGRLNNALGFNNRGGYRGTDCPVGATPAACATGPASVDRFQQLIDFPLPVVALRVWF